MSSVLLKSCGVLRESQEILSADDDLGVVADVSAKVAHAVSAWADKERKLQDQIRDWTRQVSEAEAKAKCSVSEEEHRRVLDELCTQQDERQRAYRKKEDAVRATKSETAALRAEIEALQHKKAELEQQSTVDKPSRNSKYQLYAAGCNIKWDLKEAKLVQGYVTNGVTTKTFSFDPETCSSSFIAQRLWALAAWAAEGSA